MKDFEERKIPASIKTKWLQLAEAGGFPDVDSYIENLQSNIKELQAIIDKKQLQYEKMLSTRDNLYSVITEAAALLKEIEEAIQQQKDLKIFPSKIEEFLQKVIL